MKKLSIIIPVYKINSEFLDENLKLILEEVLENKNLLELILISNGTSSDNLHILQNLKDKFDFIKLIIFDTNKGINYARDVGITESTAEYIWSIDCDDQVCKNSINEILNFLSIKKGIDYISFDSYIGLKRGNYKYLISHDQIPQNFEFKIFDLNLLKEQIKVFSAPWLYIAKKDIILKNNIKYKDSYIENYDAYFIWKYLLFVKEALVIKKPIYIYNQNTEFSVMTNIKDFVGENLHLNVLKNFIQFYEEKKGIFDQKIFLFFLSSLFDFLITPGNFNLKNKNTRKVLKDTIKMFNYLKKQNLKNIIIDNKWRKFIIRFVCNLTNLNLFLLYKKLKNFIYLKLKFILS